VSEAAARAQQVELPPLMCAPRSIDIAITSRCNLRCRYCHFFNTPSVTYRDLPAEAWLRFFDELGQCGVMRVTLTGGEPFIRDDLPTLLQGIVRNRMRFSILSNGALIDDEAAAFVGATGRCDSVQISVDGSSPEIHDSGRGKGAFEGALRGLGTLLRNDVAATVRVTIHRGNVHDLEAIARLLLDELGLPGFSTNAAGYMGSCRQAASDLLLTTEQWQLAMETLLELQGRYPGRISAMAGPLDAVHRWGRMERARHSGEPPPVDGGSLNGCGCPWNKLAVQPDGVLVPCSLLPQLELGRINQAALLQVWRSAPALEQLRQRRTIPLAALDECAGCPYTPYCTGGCPALGSHTGRLDQPDPDGCLRRFLADGGRLPPTGPGDATGGEGSR